MTPVLFIHICGAIVGLLGGWSALAFRKGSRLHRASGNVFSLGMLIMGGTGAYMGFMKEQTSNVIGGALVCYLVATAWAAVQRKEGRSALFEFGAMLVAFAAGAATLIVGFRVASAGPPFKDAIPPAPYFIFASVFLLCAVWDVRMLVRGGVSGTQRIGRHLWRMGLALFIGTASLFLGKQQHFPEGLVKTHLLNVPVVVVAVVMIFWLVRVRFAKAGKLAQPGVQAGVAR
ncbi:MAG: hypothetical protein ABSG16_07115 [Candidatus Acidiferrum sp.]|jgi:uncharacterized membrane protein